MTGGSDTVLARTSYVYGHIPEFSIELRDGKATFKYGDSVLATTEGIGWFNGDAHADHSNGTFKFFR